MNKPIKLIFYGFGAMAAEMAKILLGRPDVEIVGAIDIDSRKVGRDLSDFLDEASPTGIEVSADADLILEETSADIVLLTTTAFAKEAEAPTLQCLKLGLPVVSIVQELVYPIGENKKIADRIGDAAVLGKAQFVAVGINPGFIMDVLPIVCSTPCASIDRVKVARNVDFSPYGPDEMVHIGANLSEAEFRSGASSGEIGHIGLLETAAMVAEGLGLSPDTLSQKKEPLIARTQRRTKFITVEPGRVCGFVQTVVGKADGREVIRFAMRGVLAPNAQEDGFELGDQANLFGQPNVEIEVKREISQKGGIGTAAVAVNTIPRLLKANPGFHTLFGLGMPRLWRTASARSNRFSIEYS